MGRRVENHSFCMTLCMQIEWSIHSVRVVCLVAARRWEADRKPPCAFSAFEAIICPCVCIAARHAKREREDAVAALHTVHCIADARTSSVQYAWLRV